MIDSALCGVRGEAAAGSAELVVEVDAGGEAEQSAADAGSQVGQGACAVSFEPEQVFQRPEDALDALSDRGKSQLMAGFRLVGAAWADDRETELCGLFGELAAGGSPCRRRSSWRVRRGAATGDRVRFRVPCGRRQRASRHAGCRPGCTRGAAGSPKTSGCGCGCSRTRLRPRAGCAATCRRCGPPRRESSR